MEKKRNVIVGFEGLNEEQFALVNGVIEAGRQHSCNASYFDVPDATRTDIALLYGLGMLTGRLTDRDVKMDPPCAWAEVAWKRARKTYRKLEKTPR